MFQDETAGDIKMNYVVTRLIFITNEEVIKSKNDIKHGVFCHKTFEV